MLRFEKEFENISGNNFRIFFGKSPSFSLRTLSSEIFTFQFQKLLFLTTYCILLIVLQLCSTIY